MLSFGRHLQHNDSLLKQYSIFYKQLFKFPKAKFLITMYGCRRDPSNLICFYGAPV